VDQTRPWFNGAGNGFGGFGSYGSGAAAPSASYGRDSRFGPTADVGVATYTPRGTTSSFGAAPAVYAGRSGASYRSSVQPVNYAPPSPAATVSGSAALDSSSAAAANGGASLAQAPPVGSGVEPWGGPATGGQLPPYDTPMWPDGSYGVVEQPLSYADMVAEVQETHTGQFMFGVGVNSEAGLTGQIVISERNFDIFRPPTSWEDFANGTAWRGGGQGFRIEALPGTSVQRYMISLSEPYLLGTDISLNLSGFFYDRIYFDWDEQRYGGRIGLGYRLTPDLSVSTTMRAEHVDILDPRVVGVPALDSAVGDHDLFSARFSLTHDKRDRFFAPTQGHLLELSYEQVFGSFDYPRGDIDFRKYFLVRERPDGSGRHTLALGVRFGVTGSDTPIFENYFAGGYSTLRGFNFRGASPKESTVIVGGQYRFLGSAEYMMPLTADDMLRAVAFCDFGTVERELVMKGENFRVAPGFGLRIFVPAMGPAPIALDFAFPVTKALTDDEQIFSFFVGFGR
jgi:outer membrane protein insertion porin family